MALTPIEAAIRQQTDRRARYEAKQRAAGLVKVTRWVPADRVGELDQLLDRMVSGGA